MSNVVTIYNVQFIKKFDIATIEFINR